MVSGVKFWRDLVPLLVQTWTKP